MKMKKRGNCKSGDVDLEKRLARYDSWLHEGKVSFTSKVVPIGESLVGKQWVLPTEQVLEILRGARSFALTNCGCRSRYRRCDNPLETCFLLNDVADKFVAKGMGRYISIEEAGKVLQKANDCGLVHLTLYRPDEDVWAVCSCCPCCCHELQLLKMYSRRDLVARSDYIAQTNMDICTHCGDCIDHCIFESRIWKDGEMHYNSEACYGCGLCVTVCPEKAITMQLRSNLNTRKNV